jgi:hypothetical protein
MAIRRLDRGRGRLLTRTGPDWTHKYRPVAAAVFALPAKQVYFDAVPPAVRPTVWNSEMIEQTIRIIDIYSRSSASRPGRGAVLSCGGSFAPTKGRSERCGEASSSGDLYHQCAACRGDNPSWRMRHADRGESRTASRCDRQDPVSLGVARRPCAARGWRSQTSFIAVGPTGAGPIPDT